MKLDKRIVEGRKYLDIFDTKEAQEYIGQKCYFSDKIARFSDLGDPKLVKATLTHVKADDCEYCYGSNEIGLADWYYARYILPLAWVKEPENKYRPYNVMEFIKHYPIGSHLHFRPKDKTIEMHRLIDGYNDCLNGAGTLFVCGMMYSMRELYNNYEIFEDGEWKPFGVLDDGDEDKE